MRCFYTATKAHECGDVIAALNAMVTRRITDSRPDFSVTKVGANRLFVNEAFQALETDKSNANPNICLRAVRGYFTSIRPGRGNNVLLNVNTATSTFLPPCRVSDLLFYVTRQNEDFRYEVDLTTVEKWLHGAQLRLVYRRPPVADRDPDINDAKSRFKTF